LKYLKIILLITTLYLALAETYGQDSPRSLGPLYLRSFSGEISLENLYRRQHSLFNGIEENQNSLYFIGGMKLDLNSYLWKKDIVSFNLSTEFNPETRDEKYLLVPDRSEVRTLKKLDLQTGVFTGKPVSLTAYVNLNQNYYNRELLTNIKSNSRRFGSTLSFNNRYLPFSLSYRNSFWEQAETQNDRYFVMEKKNLQAISRKSFTPNDDHEILLSHEKYDYNYTDLHNTSNTIDRIRLNNNVYLSDDHRHNYNSSVSYFSQKGYINFNKFEVQERIVSKIRDNVRLSGKYYFYRFDTEDYLLNQHRFTGEINHRLFESLNTTLSVDYSLVDHDLYNESHIKAGGRFLYTKKIMNHRLNLSFHHYRHYLDMESESTQIRITNEELILSDTEINILDKPYVNTGSIIIKDISSTIIYQEGIDYFISELNNFIEIHRIPGGQITNNQSVLVDYTAVQPGSYGFNTAYNSYSAGLVLFNNLLEVYYRGYSQDYKNVRDSEFLILNYYTRHIYGSRINLKFATAGLEYDKYSSSIIPYESIRYYLNISKTVKSRLVMSMNANIRNYRMIDNDVNHKYYNISARTAYNFSPGTRAIIDLGYLKQEGRNINLDLLTGKAEFQTTVRQFFIKLGLQSYMRNYMNSEYLFYGTYIELTRKF